MRFGQFARDERLVWSGVARRCALLLSLAVVACGSRSELKQTIDGGEVDNKTAERCNGLDDDADTQVDEIFRDDEGRYIADKHCGACGNVCKAQGPDVLEASCGLIAEVPTCVATVCALGLAPTRAGGCAPRDMYLCLECAQDSDCGPVGAARCVELGGEQRCLIECEGGCAEGYACNDQGLCAPAGGSCSCGEGQTFDLACAVDVPDRKVNDPVCVGRARCENGVLSACNSSAEICD